VRTQNLIKHADILEAIWLPLLVVANPLGLKRLGRIVVDRSKFKADASADP
jgi:hypothetical protein